AAVYQRWMAGWQIATRTDPQDESQDHPDDERQVSRRLASQKMVRAGVPGYACVTSSPAAPDGRRYGMRSAEGVRMAEQAAVRFAGLLRQLRAAARLTQEELAEAAGLSPRSVSDLERGVNRTARRDTAELLAGALGLAGPVRALFVAAARGRGSAAEVLA